MKPELLAPVGDWETLASAIKAGADAVYFGIKWINMRSSSARNFEISELKELMKKIHGHHLKGYLTLNTVIFDHELNRVIKILDEVKAAGVDAVIAADMSVIQLCQERNIEAHISTQMSVANYQAVKFFSQFSPRIVLARECTLEQIKAIQQNIIKDNLSFQGRRIELEAFVHGSLCVAYSGRCLMSQHHNRLSANRGQCLQECRRLYKITDVEDPRREFILDDNYLLSPKDLCALPILDQLLNAGISVFKIEGRAKGPEYVYTATKTYREAIELIERGLFTDKEKLRLVQELAKVFNRGFSTNFYLGAPTNNSWYQFYGSSAKEQKTKLGKVINYYAKSNAVAILIETGSLNKGDEVCFIGPTTGYYKAKAASLKIDDLEVSSAQTGEIVSFKIKKKVRLSDAVYRIQKRNVSAEEELIKQKLYQVGVHEPFKTTKAKKGMI